MVTLFLKKEDIVNMVISTPLRDLPIRRNQSLKSADDRYIRILKNTMICRTIILPVVLYGCETWSLTLREERKLRVFENKVLRRIFGPRKEEVTEEWRRLHN